MMATDINEQVQNAYNAAKQALSDDLTLKYYNAANTRLQAFRQLNNIANAKHALFSGAPLGAQMQYDQDTFLPNAATMATETIQKQLENQEVWDKYMNYVKGLNAKAQSLKAETNDISSVINNKNVSTGGGVSKPPAGSAYGTFSGE